MGETVQCMGCGHKHHVNPGWLEVVCGCGVTRWNRPAPLLTSGQDSPLDRQEGGGHYKDQPIQPVEYIHANGIGYFEGNVIKYVSRWRKKNGLEDLKKAKHYIELLIELEQKKEQA